MVDERQRLVAEPWPVAPPPPRLAALAFLWRQVGLAVEAGKQTVSDEQRGVEQTGQLVSRVVQMRVVKETQAASETEPVDDPKNFDSVSAEAWKRAPCIATNDPRLKGLGNELPPRRRASRRIKFGGSLRRAYLAGQRGCPDAGRQRVEAVHAVKAAHVGNAHSGCNSRIRSSMRLIG